MKFLLLATLVAICSASSKTLYRSKTISVNEGGIILISSPSGRLATLSRTEYYPGVQEYIEISYSGPNIDTRRIEIIDNPVDGYSSQSSYDVLYGILQQYQGSVDEVSYKKLLTQVGAAVQKGLISRQIFEFLVLFDQIDDPLFLQKFEEQVAVAGKSLYLRRYFPGLYAAYVQTQAQELSPYQLGVIGQGQSGYQGYSGYYGPRYGQIYGSGYDLGYGQNYGTYGTRGYGPSSRYVYQQSPLAQRGYGQSFASYENYPIVGAAARRYFAKDYLLGRQQDLQYPGTQYQVTQQAQIQSQGQLQGLGKPQQTQYLEGLRQRASQEQGGYVNEPTYY